MSKISEQLRRKPEDTREWYIRDSRGSVRGPVRTRDLVRWTHECRVIASTPVSSDREVWVDARTIPDLELEWESSDPANTHGPFNMQAVPELVREGVIARDDVLRHRPGQSRLPAPVPAQPAY